MKGFIKTFLRTGIFFGLWMGIYFSIIYDLKTGVESGIACGISFGAVMTLFSVYNSNKTRKNRPPFVDEKIIKEDAANHFMGAESVGGWIYLTDKRLVFKSHSLNIQNHELSIPLSDIENAMKGRFLRIFSNRLQLKLKNGKVEKFVVNEPDDWIKSVKALN